MSGMESFNMFGNDFNMWEEAKARALKHNNGAASHQQDTTDDASGRPVAAVETENNELPPQPGSFVREISSSRERYPSGYAWTPTCIKPVFHAEVFSHDRLHAAEAYLHHVRSLHGSVRGLRMSDEGKDMDDNKDDEDKQDEGLREELW